MSIVLERMFKFFDDHCVVNDVTLEVRDGELFVLLGPSGSGKSTVLRIVAGLLASDGGRVLLHGRDVSALPARRRGVGFVFQHYALFRHMTVAENVEFALSIRRVRGADRRARCESLLELVGLVGLERRYPHQLSGGQQQRVALARALAHEPDVLLLDEPFGALDAKIRSELRRSLRAIQRELGVTTIFVTHDQEEAFELADRLGVMNDGRLLEIGAPTELYVRPETEFVATFLGKANLMVGECSGNSVRLGDVRLPLGDHVATSGYEQRVQVLFRPEDVAVKDSPEALGWPLLGEGVVEEGSFSGSVEKLRLRLPRLEGVRTILPDPPFGAACTVIDAERSQHQARRFPLRPGDRAWVGLRRIHVLTHPGLRFLLVVDEAPWSEPAVHLGSQIARLSHARVTLLGLGEDSRAHERLQRARERLRGCATPPQLRTAREGLSQAVRVEADRHVYDLVVHGHPGRGVADTVEKILRAGRHHALLVPAGADVPRRVLICTAVGEPGKDDVLFTGRLVRHLGATATILTVRPERCPAESLEQARRFLEAGRRTLALLGVEAPTSLRRGGTREQILAEIAEGGHDLVVVGALAAGPQGEVRLGALARGLLEALSGVPVLVVRSRLAREGEQEAAPPRASAATA